MSQIPSAKLKKSNHPLSQSETQNQKFVDGHDVDVWTSFWFKVQCDL